MELLLHGVGRSMERARKRELAGLQRGLPVLATIASSAPFVGLFGTVFGIITAFEQMADPSKGGGGGLATVSAGIAEALLTTAVGLAVAIVSVWFYNFFTNRVEELGTLMEDASGELSDRLMHGSRARSRSDRAGCGMSGEAARRMARLRALRQVFADDTHEQPLPSVKSDINVTPLVDVVLVLLIIFMVVTPMIASGVAVDLPKTAHHLRKPDDGKDIIVSVTQDKRYYVGTTRVNRVEDLSAAIKNERRRFPEKTIFVKRTRGPRSALCARRCRCSRLRTSRRRAGHGRAPEDRWRELSPWRWMSGRRSAGCRRTSTSRR